MDNLWADYTDVILRTYRGGGGLTSTVRPMAGSDGEARLKARNAELAAWADRAGHDLRTPLAVISGMAETLEAAWDRLGVEDRARMLASIRNQAAKAMAMVDEAVTLARGTDPTEAEGES